MELGRLFGYLHPALVHFPLVLLLVSFGLEAAGYVRRDERLAWSAKLTLLLGAVATLFAFVCGNFAEIWAARDGVPQDPMELHELYATITSWLFVFLAAARLYIQPSRHRRWTATYLGFMAAGCVLLIITGHKGAMLVYQHAAGVQVGIAHPLPTHEDLAVLRQKQDAEALFYSNNMHHIFGTMVMTFSGLLLVQMLSPRWGRRLRAVTPLLLLAGGIFLLIFSDTDSWPLSHQRPITDKEVVMHKTYSVLMLFFGIQGLRRRKRPEFESGIAVDAEAPTERRQGRLMAVFSLIGGALLFTHVHSNAPYANVAVGVYIHHTVMGFIALLIGAVKLLEDRAGGTSRRSAMRALAWAYPSLMLIESIFLLNYNEGLPWFLGYRNLSLNAPHNGLIAPLGRQRAEMVFDPATARMDLYLLHQKDDRPAPANLSGIDAVARVGTESTEIALTPVPEPEGSYHYTATAPFLRGVPMFQTMVYARPADTERGRALIADFEPWTDERAAAQHRSQAAYVCPMHPAVGAGSPGRCTVCGMALVANRSARPAGKLHDDQFAMDLGIFDQRGTRIAGPAPGQEVALRFTPRGPGGAVVTCLDVVHTKRLHLIVVSHDLSFFDHVHPETHPDGTLTLQYRFPAAGEYRLYADLTPTGDRNQVFSLPVTVAGSAAPAQPLHATEAQARSIGDYRVRLDVSPSPALPGDETQLTFTLFRDGVPVTDIEPYLGAGGHCVALSEDLTAYLHSHPLEMGAAQYGPSVTFHTLFPRKGLYKIWGQFQHRGRIVVADFVVRVQ